MALEEEKKKKKGPKPPNSFLRRCTPPSDDFIAYSGNRARCDLKMVNLAQEVTMSVEDTNESNSVMESHHYDITLPDWLEKNDTLSTDHLRWSNNQELRPSDDTREVIAGLLPKVADYLEEHGFHGELSDPTRFVLKKLKNGKFDVRILDPHERSNNSDRQEARRLDLNDVAEIIFTIIMKGNLTAEAEHLKKQLTGTSEDTDCVSECRELAGHPYLWDYQTRIDYIDRVHQYMKKDEPNIAPVKPGDGTGYVSLESIMNSFRNPAKGSCLNYWVPTVLHKPGPDDSVFRRFYLNQKAKYDTRHCAFFRFLRNFYGHVLAWKTNMKGQSRRFIRNTEPEWVNYKYVEYQVTATFPKALLTLYLMIQTYGISV